MCLRRKLSEDDKKKIIDKIDKKGMKVYKLVKVMDSVYYPIYFNVNRPYEEGVNEAEVGNVWTSYGFSYSSGYHFYKSERTANRHCEHMSRSIGTRAACYSIKVIECIVKKSWVSEIGTQCGVMKNGRLAKRDRVKVVVAKKAIFPKS